jgi:hypothetical protein
MHKRNQESERGTLEGKKERWENKGDIGDIRVCALLEEPFENLELAKSCGENQKTGFARAGAVENKSG